MKISLNENLWIITKSLDITTFSTRERAAFYIRSAKIGNAAPCDICGNSGKTYSVTDWSADLCLYCRKSTEIHNNHSQIAYGIVYWRSNYHAQLCPDPALIIMISHSPMNNYSPTYNITRFCVPSNAALYRTVINIIHHDLMSAILMYWIGIEVNMLRRRQINDYDIV